MKRRGFTLMELLVVLGVVGLLGMFLLGGASCAVGCHGLTASSGYRDGTIQKFSSKGIIFDTYEGELAVEGFKATTAGGTQSTWEFSVWDDEIAKQLQSAQGKHRLYYRQHRHVWPWIGETAYEVYKIE